MFVDYPLLAGLFEVSPLITDNDYCVEEMLKGQRLLVSKHGDVVRAFSRGRIEYFLPLSVLDLARSLPEDFIFEGELVGESFIAFEMLSGCGVDVSGEPFILRRKLLALLSPFPIAAHAKHEREKTRLMEFVLGAGGAGVVFKRLDAPYDSRGEILGIRFNNYVKGSYRANNRSIKKFKRSTRHAGVGRFSPSLGVPARFLT
jgi:ATP-dependent DNA ligase